MDRQQIESFVCETVAVRCIREVTDPWIPVRTWKIAYTDGWLLTLSLPAILCSGCNFLPRAVSKREIKAENIKKKEIQTYTKLKRTLFIKTKHNMQKGRLVLVRQHKT